MEKPASRLETAGGSAFAFPAKLPYIPAMLPRSARMSSSAVIPRENTTGRFFVRPIEGLSAELRKNTLASEIAVNESIQAGIPVAQIVADKAFAERLVKSGIVPRRTLQYAVENKFERFTPGAVGADRAGAARFRASPEKRSATRPMNGSTGQPPYLPEQHPPKCWSPRRGRGRWKCSSARPCMVLPHEAMARRA